MARRGKRIERSRGDRNIAWIEKHCRVPEGMHVGQAVKLREWQREIIRDIYDTPTRRAIVSFPRKSGKTALTALLLLLHLVGPEARANSQIYSAAQSRDQASLVFAYAAKMARLDPTLAAHVKIKDTAKSLVVPELGTVYRALSADAQTAYGLSPVLVIHDELGQVRGPKSELYDALETSMGAQAEPLSIVISTQAPTDGDLLSVLIDDAKSGADPRTKLWFYGAGEDEDIFDEQVWRKAHPALGDFSSLDEFKEAAERARRMPASEAAFRNLMLNMRVELLAPFITRSAWMACADEVDENLFYQAPVYAGLDLSSRQDLTALVLVAQDENGVWHIKPEFWTPGATLVERAKRDRAPYELWMQKGHLYAPPGSSIDYKAVARRLAQVAEDCDLRMLAFDRWRMDVLQAAIEELGVPVPMQPFGQGFKDMAPALDVTEHAVLERRLRHGAHPVLTWCCANAVVQRDPAGNRKLDKAKSTGRIDGMAALVMAMAVAAAQIEVEDHGLIML